ncbi:MAG: PBP1A family penicillin-binding protein [Deltaproteobacteria bacterium]|nr:PBP1A family penicillin-binding protein [Deltaproteobacteria bacterium]MBW1719565.1 PBP1A family penicillin-binding protein [Deltaproteobacteria bacterium]MBW1938819.1 PBP1A family penicillin-binding protein [Deltaproteobacteria bacterium]MBW2080529.1 PBP1A family penicillin-binding protein [Deltaproteobacteria bacterium]MBW2351031.1 PBP1A family penicillin-binding protein [Deltaproteobacteria bacterium]
MAKIRRKKFRKPLVWDYRPLLGILLGSALLVFLTIGSFIIGYMLLGLPEISSLKSYSPPMVTEVLDSDHRPIAYWYKEKRWPVPISRMPDSLVQAFLAAEDSRFYEHPGIDFMGVIRAIVKNVEAGGIVQGASTITQQVTRSLLLTPEKSWLRKVKEAILAWQIDAALTKDEILTIYLNQIYFGQGAYGVESAARTYFAKHVDGLNLAECALFAGLPKAPSWYDPTKHMDRAKKRQHYVLRRMVEEGYITSDEAEEAKKTPIRLKRETLDPPPATDYFLSEVRKELEARYGKKRLLTDGLTVITTLKRDWQIKANEAVLQGLDSLYKRHTKDRELNQFAQAALVAIETKTGAVQALWGGKDFNKSQFNLATQGRMQPGSAFKAIIYSTALYNGLVAPNTIVVDEPISLPGADSQTMWEPENFDKTYMGPITIRTALIYSRNIISVKIARVIGLTSIHDMAGRMGIETPLANNLSISLGSSEVTLIEMARAFSTFPNLGKNIKPQFIQEVRNRKGERIEQLEPVFTEAVDPLTAFQMVHLLEGVIREGTGRSARALGIPAGGKTGTTDNCRDAWFIGFTPEVVAAVWVGREDKKTLGEKETGGRVACPIWTSFMSATKEEMIKQDFSIPQGIALVPVDRQTGEIIIPKKDDETSFVWEAMREDLLTPLHPSSGKFRLPSWLKRLDDFLF